MEVILEKIRRVLNGSVAPVKDGVPLKVYLEIQKALRKEGELAVVAGIGNGYYPVVVTKLAQTGHVVIVDEWDLSICLNSDGMKRFLAACGRELDKGRVVLLKKSVEKLETEWCFGIDFLLIDCSGIVEAQRFVDKLIPFVKKGGDIVIAASDKVVSKGWAMSVPRGKIRRINGVLFIEKW